MAFPTTIFGKTTDIYKESTTQHHPLGTRLVLGDGRVFRYAKNASTALAIGKLCASPVVLPDEDVDLEAEAAITTAARDATIIVTGSSSLFTVAANRFKEGYLNVNTGTGAGQVVQLKSNDAGGSSTGATVKVYFEDDNFLSVALDTSNSKIGLVQNPYDSVVVAPALAVVTTNHAVQRPAGVPPITVSLGSSTPYYFWLQTWGACSVLMGAAAPAIGELVRQGGTSTGSAGSILPRIVSTSSTLVGTKLDLPQVGVVIAGDAAAEYALVFLTIAP